MRIAPMPPQHAAAAMPRSAAPAPMPAATAAAAIPSRAEGDAWRNPAAAAALRSTVQILRGVEDNIARYYGDVERVRAYATDLRAAGEIVGAASDALTGDGDAVNDQFLPLLSRAAAHVNAAETRLSAKGIDQSWPAERSEILSLVRTARVITGSIADQLDPNGNVRQR